MWLGCPNQGSYTARICEGASAVGTFSRSVWRRPGWVHPCSSRRNTNAQVARDGFVIGNADFVRGGKNSLGCRAARSNLRSTRRVRKQPDSCFRHQKGCQGFAEAYAENCEPD